MFFGHGLKNELFPGIWITNKWKFVIQMFLLFRCLPFRSSLYLIYDHSKYRHFDDRISNSLVFKAFFYGNSYGPYHLKTGPFQNLTFCPDFKWFLTKGQPFMWISNGQVCRFQISIVIRTIWKPNSLWLFKIWLCPDLVFIITWIPDFVSEILNIFGYSDLMSWLEYQNI